VKRIILLISLSILLASPLLAEGKPDNTKPDVKAEPKSSATSHSVEIDGGKIDYTATAGWLIMKNQQGEPIARFGYTAYTRDGVRDRAQRPVMFAFNGGPGSSSIWLHMGILGPRRVVVPVDKFTPPYRRVDNVYSVINVTDLVMVDPVGTGFSRTLGDAKGEDFWGVDQDIRSVGEFIERYVTENGRWASPKYILGESYGGVRSAGLVWHMQKAHNMSFNGVVMVSPFLSMEAGSDGAGIDLPHVLYLSTLAATAWYHDTIEDKPEKLEDFLDEVSRFAYERYAPALMKGYAISDSEKRAVAEKLAAYTGTGADYWMKADLRVTHRQFLQEFKRDERLITGRIDSRYTGPSLNPLSEHMDYDPFFASVGPAFTAAFKEYLREELEFGQDEEYNVWASITRWDWHHGSPSGGGRKRPWTNMLPDLSMALTTNQGLRVLVLQGYYDLATPALAASYYIDHLDIPRKARRRVEVEYFEAGHMMYLHEPSMKKFRRAVADFIVDSDK